MAKLIFYCWEVGMRGIPIVMLLKEKTHLSLKQSQDIKEIIKDGISYEVIIEDEDVANEVYEKHGNIKCWFGKNK